mgnify:FL=1|tara:strand:+ start:255 stop:1256 length:1002 start_codon:yes stop_codon:yes gene_type:complete
MFFGILTLIVGLAISGVAAWYSIVGLMAIFAAAKIPIAIMGAVLEVGKLLTASWLYQYWDKANKLIKTYFMIAVVVLMFITSMGIFGFLSKAHMDQTLSVGDNSLLIERLDKKIDREQVRIKDAETVIGQLDKAVQVLIDYDRIRGPSGSIAVRESQNEEREQLSTVIDDAYIKIDGMSMEKLELDKEQLALEAEVGPIKYIAAFIYGDDLDSNLLDKAVRWIIVTIIFVFDPLAVLLIVAANMTLKEAMGKPKKVNITKAADATKKEWSEIKLEHEPYVPSEKTNEAIIKAEKKAEEKVPDGYVKTNHVGFKKKKVSPLGFKLNVDLNDDMK